MEHFVASENDGKRENVLSYNELNGLYAIVLRLCDLCQIFVTFYLCYFLMCVSVLWMSWAPSWFHVCMNHLFLLMLFVVVIFTLFNIYVLYITFLKCMLIFSLEILNSDMYIW